jgi:sulfur-oxidizing protein SoxZ
MAKLTKIRTRSQDGAVEVVVLVTHPMEVGVRKDKETGKVIPAHFIQELNVELNGKLVVACQTGAAVSENPLLVFRFDPATIKNGDKVKVSWKDNKGGSEVAEHAVSL